MDKKTTKHIIATLVDLPLPARLRAASTKAKPMTRTKQKDLDFYIRNYEGTARILEQWHAFHDALEEAMKQPGFVPLAFIISYNEANPKSYCVSDDDIVHNALCSDETGNALLYDVENSIASYYKNAEIVKFKYLLALNNISQDFEMPELQAA